MGQSEARLGDLLIENGLITREQLEQALRRQRGKQQDKGLSSWA
jgi:6,7-dimethyl-8-ribityllumazine synthase